MFFTCVISKSMVKLGCVIDRCSIWRQSFSLTLTALLFCFFWSGQMIYHAYSNYAKYAWAANEHRPISKQRHSANVFGSNSLGINIIDSLDTIYLAELKDLYSKSRQWIESEFRVDVVRCWSILRSARLTRLFRFPGERSVGFRNKHSSRRWISFNLRFDQWQGSTRFKWEEQVRTLVVRCFDFVSVVSRQSSTGGRSSLAGVQQCNWNPLCSHRSVEVRLNRIFVWDRHVRLLWSTNNSGRSKNWNWAAGGCAILSELGTMHLEFQYLSQLTGKDIYLQKVSWTSLMFAYSRSLSLTGREDPQGCPRCIRE